MPAIGVGTGSSEGERHARANVRRARSHTRPTVAPAAPPGPFTDAQRRRVTKFKRTKTYTRAIGDAYKAQPAPQRNARLNQIANKLTQPDTPSRLPHGGAGHQTRAKTPQHLNTEDKAVARVYLRRLARLDKAMKSPVYTDRARRYVENFKKQPTFLRALEDAKLTNVDKRDRILFDSSSTKLKKLGFKQEGFVDKAFKAPTAAVTEVPAIAEAFYHHPGSVAGKTAQQLALAVPGAIGGVAKMVLHPGSEIPKFVQGSVDVLNTPYKQKVARIEKEGALTDAATAAIFLAPSSRLLALRGGERAALRISGGLVKGRKTRGVVGHVVGTGFDRYKASRYEKALADGKELPALKLQAALANRKAGRVVEVVPTRAGAKIKRAVAGARGRAVYQLHSDLGATVGRMNKRLAGLNKHEKRAFWFSAAGGIRNAEQARKFLPDLKRRIEASRPDNFKAKGRYKRIDMVARIDEILQDPEKYFTKNLDEIVTQIRPAAIRAGMEDPRYSAATRLLRRHADQNALLGLERGVTGEEAPALRYGEESVPAYIRRANKVAEEHGLRAPLYVKSERHRAGTPDFGSFTAGGKRAMAFDRKYKGKNLEAGLMDMSPEAFTRGVAHNVKAKHNWRLVDQMVRSHAIEDLAPGGGLPVGKALDRINEMNVAPGSVALWNPGIFRAKARAAGSDHALEQFANAEEAGAAKILDGIKAATADPASLSKADLTELAKSKGWKVVPVQMLRELEHELQPSSPALRAWDISKGKASRAILLAGNVPWFGFQVVSEAGTAAAFTRGGILNPVNWLGTAKWWKQMTDAERAEVGSWVGLNATGGDLKQTRMGAAVMDGSTPAAAINAYRAMKAHPIWHTGLAKGKGPSLSDLNPLEVMVKADRTKTNVIRLLTAHSVAKRAIVKQMGQDMGLHQKAMQRVLGVFKLAPEKQLQAFARNPHMLEDMANHLNDWLGDWTSLTAAERKGWNRVLMFFPYLRYSVRLVLYTLPRDHPAVTALLAELGNLQADEYRKIFGDDQLSWNIGKIYFGKGGNAKSIDLKRANPALNALFDVGLNHNIGSLIGTTPPYVQWIGDQLYHRSSFADRDWRVGGAAAAYGTKGSDYGLETRARILLNSALTTMYPTRVIEKSDPQQGTLGDDSLPWDPRPIVYKGKTTVSKLQAKNAKTQEAFDAQHGGSLGNLLLGPLYPSPTRDVQAAKDRAYVKAVQKRIAEEGKRGTHKSPFPGVSSGGAFPGVSSSHGAFPG